MEPPETQPGLRKDQLSFIENVAQSIGNMAPSGGVALLVPLAFAFSGNVTWLLYLGIMVAYWLIGLNINEFATRTASPGALSHFSEVAFGATAGVAAGWVYVIALVFCLISPALTFAHYMIVFYQAAGLADHGPLVGVLFLLLGTVIMVGISIKGIRMSTDLILLMECISVGLMLVLTAVFLFWGHHGVDHDQFRLTGVTWRGMRSASILALFAMSGFETVVCFGGESKKALKNIPRALLAGLLPVGLLFFVMSYVMVFSFKGFTTPLDQAAAPFDHLAAVCGLPFFGHLINFGVMMSFFACALAGLNAASRVLFSMARKHLVWRRLGTARTAAATPRAALLLIGAVSVGIPLVMMAAGLTLDQCIDYTTQIGACGYILSYTGVCVGAPVYLWRLGQLRGRHVLLSLAAAAILSLPLVATVYPVPDGAPRYFPYLVLAGSVLATAASCLFQRRNPVAAIPAEAVAEAATS